MYKKITVDFTDFKYKDGFYFTLTFMHGDADYYTTSKYYIGKFDKDIVEDFCQMLMEIKDTRSLPMNHLYWLNELKQEDRENLEYWFEDEDVIDKILNSHAPEFISEDIIQKVNFTIPFDDIEYTNDLAELVDIDITCVMDGWSYNVKFE